MLIGDAFVRIYRHALGNEITAFAVPAAFYALLFPEHCAASRADKFGIIA